VTEKPFWEESYSNDKVSTFAKRPSIDVLEFFKDVEPGKTVIDVGCGEGRNSIYLAELGHNVDAFDISVAGVNKAKKIAVDNKVSVNFWVQDLAEFVFEKEYDMIVSQGVLHLPEKDVRDNFIKKAMQNTKVGGYDLISIFTNRLPATPDNAPFTKSLFDVGELPEIYKDWEIIKHEEKTLKDEHPGGIRHEHAIESIIAKKVVSN